MCIRDSRYVIPTTGTATATKKWVDGPSPKPIIWFRLHRKTAMGSWEVVPGAEIKKVTAKPDGTLSASWDGLATTDIYGNAYEFGVMEGRLDGTTFTPVVPENYTATEQPSLNIVNTYDPPADATFIATKTCLLYTSGLP